jgi:hypothetical protein
LAGNKVKATDCQARDFDKIMALQRYRLPVDGEQCPDWLIEQSENTVGHDVA